MNTRHISPPGPRARVLGASLLALWLAGVASLQAQITDLASFNGTNGASLQASLTLSGSTLYGITVAGGANNDGTVFSVPVGGGTPTTLATFNGTNGGLPNGSLTLSGSTLYGVTYEGGANGDGTVFSVPAGGGTPTTLATFSNNDGEFPRSGLTLSGSTLYGTTSGGGANNDGTVFSVPVGGGTPTTLASFNNTNGEFPDGSLTLSSDGSTLYSTTNSGGANGYGTVFSVPVGGGTPTTLASFNKTDGATPYGGLTLSGSTLYGATSGGGANSDGTVFSVPVGGGTPTTLASFNGTNGVSPLNSLTLSADGSTLYGTTELGGANNDGVVFSVPVSAPEPGSATLLVTGLLAMALRRRVAVQPH